MHANALAGEPLWIIKARLFGLKSHDDHMLMQCSMPEVRPRLDCRADSQSIFSLSKYSDLGGVREGSAWLSSTSAADSAAIPVNDVSDRMQTQLEARLEEANQTSRMIWDQVEVRAGAVGSTDSAGDSRGSCRFGPRRFVAFVGAS